MAWVRRWISSLNVNKIFLDKSKTKFPSSIMVEESKTAQYKKSKKAIFIKDSCLCGYVSSYETNYYHLLFAILFHGAHKTKKGKQNVAFSVPLLGEILWWGLPVMKSWSEPSPAPSIINCLKIFSDEIFMMSPF